MLVRTNSRRPRIVGTFPHLLYNAAMPLTDLACRKAKPSDRLKKCSDMHGLQLWIFPNGSKLWRCAYRFGGKQKLLAFGKYPEVSLHEARQERDKARELLRQGRDPSHVKAVTRLE